MGEIILFRGNSDEKLGSFKTQQELETLLLGIKAPGEMRVSLPLGVPLQALLDRKETVAGVVVLKSQGKEVRLSRNTDKNPGGDVSVSCQPDGDIVPIQTINIPFREYTDPATCKGMVWIYPGKSAEASMIVYPAAIKKSRRAEEIWKIVTDAKSAAQGVLDRFA
ncbi:MAG TPA: hypothetical protein PK609_03965, partial [Candidatus Paceibacterota bacterium]|nr:hypothetical protein [Candidatus Paceibacterota bacterium]